MTNLEQLLKRISQTPWEYDTELADGGSKGTPVYSKSKNLHEPVCLIPHDDITEVGYREVQANAKAIVLFTKHGPALVEALANLYREAASVANDHHKPRYARLDNSLDAAGRILDTIEQEAGS